MWRLVGIVWYFTFTCPNITFAINEVYVNTLKPRTETNFHTVKRIIQDLKGTKDYELSLQVQ